MPAGLIQEENGVGARGDLGGDLVLVHAIEQPHDFVDPLLSLWKGVDPMQV
jgi:hypothetical protein